LKIQGHCRRPRYDPQAISEW